MDPLATVDWRVARDTDVANFLRSGIARSTYRINGRRPSAITVSRYWTVLNRLYAYECECGGLLTNPCAGSMPSPERVISSILPSTVWQGLKEETISGASIWRQRDRAIMKLFFVEAISNAELRGLRLCDVLRRGEYLLLRIDGGEHGHHRVLDLQVESAVEVQAWLDHRVALGSMSQDPDAPLFVSRRGNQIFSKDLYFLVSKLLLRVYRRLELPLPPRLGPSVLRNTRIVQWCEAGMSEQDVIERLGYKDWRSLRGLRVHIKWPDQLPMTLLNIRDDDSQARTNVVDLERQDHKPISVKR